MSKKKAASTVSTSQLIAEVSTHFDEIPKKLTKELVSQFLSTIETHIASGCKVRIDKLGILQVRERAARQGRNPQTGETIKIPASKKVSFRASSALKERLGVKKKAIAVRKKK